MRKRLLVATGLFVLLLAMGSSAAALVRWNGKLGYGYGGAGVGIHVKVGAPFSIADTELKTRRRVRIEAIRLHGASRDVQLVGALIPATEGEGGDDLQFPPSFLRGHDLRPAVGTVIPAGGRVQVVLGLRATRPGGFRVHGFDVLYREHWLGVDIRRQTHTGVEVDGCATKGDPLKARCPLPHFTP